MRPLRALPTLFVSLAALAAGGSLPAADGFHWSETEAGITDLHVGDQPVLRYMHGSDTSTKERAHETYKVYHHVFGPGTETVITKGPGGQYTHHRGMYVGWNKTKAEGKSYDFWHCNKGERLEHREFVEKSGDAKSGRMTATIDWNDAEGLPVIVETRTIVATQPAPNVFQFDWSTKLESKRGDVELDGDRQHAGFQFRAAQEVAEKNGARYLRPEGFPQEPEAFQVGDADTPPKHVDLPWLAMTYEVDGERYTTEYHEAPGHPQPRRYSERPYGRFGAFFATTLTEAKPLEMQYRVIVTHGPTPARAEIQKRHEEYVATFKKAN